MEKRVIRTGGFIFSDYEKKVLYDVIDSNRITENERTNEFEKNWAKKIGTKYAIAVNSGTSALISGLYALKYLNKEDKRKKVITTPLTFISTTNAILLSGLEPVYADVNRDTFDINAKGIEKILSENNPKEFFAILPVHLIGYPCNMNEINRIAKENNLYVIEDSAEAHGTKYNGKNVGTFSDLSIFSFYVAHNIQAAGELGAVNTNSKEIKDMVKKIKAHGRICACDICRRMEGKCPNKFLDEMDMDPRFTFSEIGFNFKTNEFATAIANIRIKQMEETNSRRREIVQYLNEGLKNYSNILQLPKYSEDVSYLAYPIILKKGSRKLIRSKLEGNGIETRALFGCIPTQQPSMSAYKKEYEGKLPNADYIGSNGFYIGVRQDMTKEDLDYIIYNFREILK
jgi:dTDP-4-amino-4,6-dideoxygalactose transaminase